MKTLLLLPPDEIVKLLLRGCLQKDPKHWQALAYPHWRMLGFPYHMEVKAEWTGMASWISSRCTACNARVFEDVARLPNDDPLKEISLYCQLVATTHGIPLDKLIRKQVSEEEVQAVKEAMKLSDIAL